MQVQTVKAFAALVASSLFGVLAAAACGGSTAGDIVDPAPVTTNDPTEPTDPGAPGAGGTGTGSGGATTPPAGTGTTGNPPANPPASTKSITCGTAACNAASQECCVSASPGGGGGGATQTCLAKGACDGDLVLSCSSAASCAGGQVCCLDVSAGGSTSTCKTACTNSGPGGRPIQLCTTNAECKSNSCQTAQLGFKVCQSMGGGGPKFDGGGGGPKFDGGFGGM